MWSLRSTSASAGIDGAPFAGNATRLPSRTVHVAFYLYCTVRIPKANGRDRILDRMPIRGVERKDKRMPVDTLSRTATAILVRTVQANRATNECFKKKGIPQWRIVWSL